MERLADKKGFPKILKLERKVPCYNALAKMGVKLGDDVVLVSPGEIMELMKNVRRGELITISEICQRLAEKHGVKGCCTLTTGIFIKYIASAVEEAAKEGVKLDIPYWRTLKAGGYLNEKYPGGLEGHKKLLEGEGFKVSQKGRKYFVENYQNYLNRLS